MTRGLTRSQRTAYKGAVWIHFADEAPKIGTGRRPVVVDTLGHVWAHVRSPTKPKQGKYVQRIRRDVWDRLSA